MIMVMMVFPREYHVSLFFFTSVAQTRIPGELPYWRPQRAPGSTAGSAVADSNYQQR